VRKGLLLVLAVGSRQRLLIRRSRHVPPAIILVEADVRICGQAVLVECRWRSVPALNHVLHVAYPLHHVLIGSARVRGVKHVRTGELAVVELVWRALAQPAVLEVVLRDFVVGLNAAVAREGGEHVGVPDARLQVVVRRLDGDLARGALLPLVLVVVLRVLEDARDLAADGLLILISSVVVRIRRDGQLVVVLKHMLLVADDL